MSTAAVLTTATLDDLRSMVEKQLAEVAGAVADDEFARGFRLRRSTTPARRFVLARIVARFDEVPAAMEPRDLEACREFLADWLRALRADSAA
jgi:hypothetical protein